MAKRVAGVVLKAGTDQDAFISEWDSVDEVELKNRLPNSPTIIAMSIEEDYLDTFRSHSAVIDAQYEQTTEPTVTYPSIPSTYTQSNKTVVGWINAPSTDGDDYMSMTHYLDTDIIKEKTDDNIGCHDDDDSLTYANATYYSTYTGKHVDIVAIEGVGFSAQHPDTSFNGYHTHREWDDPDNTGTSRCIPTNWSGLSSTHNTQQIQNNRMVNAHACGTLSSAAGYVGGMAKKSQLRIAYLDSSQGDYTYEVIDAVKTWHNNKSTNGTTGLKNPTILILEWQTHTSNYHAIKIADITSVTDPEYGTTNRPTGGWGNDFTEFVKRNMIPWQLRDPGDNSWHWVMTFPRQDQYAADKTAIEQAWDAGLVVVSGPGNQGGIYVKDSDSRWDGAYCDVTGTVDYYDIRSPSDTGGSQNDPVLITKLSTNTIPRWYKFRAHAPHGLDKAIEVAAGQNSEKYQVLDAYTGRGPGVDIIGRGSNTWTAGEPADSTYADGYKWGWFGGTSCAMPSVAGKLACMMEEYYTLNGTWPTPSQVKNMAIAESRPTSLSVKTTNWSNVPNPSDTDIDPTEQNSSKPCLKIKSGPGGTAPNAELRFLDHAGTRNRQAFWNAKGYNREQTHGERPLNGVLFPRPRKFNYPPQDE